VSQLGGQKRTAELIWLAIYSQKEYRTLRLKLGNCRINMSSYSQKEYRTLRLKLGSRDHIMTYERSNVLRKIST
jgi:hypothetical protein